MSFFKHVVCSVACTLSLGLFAQSNPANCTSLGPNLITNGEFDAGNQDFTSSYAFNPDYICEFGQYTVTERVIFDPLTVCYGVPGFSLRTIWADSDRSAPGVGNFLIVDPSEATGADDDVWRQQVEVCESETYVFSVYAKNVYFLEAPNYSGVDPEFALDINGVAISNIFIDGVAQPSGTFTIPRQPQADSAQWFRISGTWVPAAGVTSADLAIRNLVSGSEGNDLAIDGIYFGLCGAKVEADITGNLVQCSTTGNVAPVTFEPDAATKASGWLYYEWYKDGGLVFADNTPSAYTTVADADGNYFGEYQLRVYRDPFGGGCGHDSDIIRISEDCSVAFPVEWADFWGENEGNEVILHWVTATESQSDRFVVERQGPGESIWTRTSSLDAAGNSQELLSYQATDRVSVAGLYRYRIAQLDLDGSIHYSSQIELYAETGAMTLQAYPNPSHGIFKLRADGLGAQRMHLQVLDMMGRQVFQKTLPGDQAQWEGTIDLSSIPKRTVSADASSGRSAAQAAITHRIKYLHKARQLGRALCKFGHEDHP